MFNSCPMRLPAWVAVGGAVAATAVAGTVVLGPALTLGIAIVLGSLGGVVALNLAGVWLLRNPPGVQPAPGPPQPAAVLPEGLPEERRAQVERIHHKAAGLLAAAPRFPTGSRSLHLVQRTLGAYLPATLASYLVLPPGTGGRVVTADGRTSDQVLRDQLALLEASLDEIAIELWRADVGRMLANERFLAEHLAGGAQPPAAESLRS
jgi:hypothetical protein